MDVAALTPAQRRLVDDLLSLGQPRPIFPAHLADRLRQRLETALAPAASSLDEPLWVNKTALAQVHTCEANYLAERQWDGWTVPMAEGEVSHRAVRLSTTAEADATPLDLVDQAIAEVAADEAGSLGGFVATLSSAARAELRAQATNAVTTFLECWPPLKASWRPRSEFRVEADLCGRRVVLKGKIDLSLGVANGLEARCLFIDLKTGGHYPSHLDDLRFYALVQTLRTGVPPFRVASYYLDSANFAAEDITEETLEIAALRLEHGVQKMAELHAKARGPTVTPCPRCRYCRIRPECPGAVQWDRRHDGDSDGDGEGEGDGDGAGEEKDA